MNIEKLRKLKSQIVFIQDSIGKVKDTKKALCEHFNVNEYECSDFSLIDSYFIMETGYSLNSNFNYVKAIIEDMEKEEQMSKSERLEEF